MVKNIVQKYEKLGTKTISLIDSLEIIKRYDLPIAKYLVIREYSDLKLASKINYPVVLKVSSPFITHKTEIGGVILNIESFNDLVDKYSDLKKKLSEKFDFKSVFDGFVVQEMVSDAYEVIIGGLNDEQFGAVVMFGLGGIYVEIFKDVVFELAPVSRMEALEMIRRIKGYELLKGYRGKKGINMEYLSEVIHKVSVMFSELSCYFKEMDLNPVFVSSEFVKIVDARFTLL